MAPADPNLGARIKALREAKGWTQADLAARAKLSVIYVAKMEGGDRVPTLATLKRLARALGVALVIDLRPLRRAPRR